MSTRWQRISAVSVLVLCACATQTTGPATSSRGTGDAPQASTVPDPARVPQAAGKSTSYPCEITNPVLIAGDRISDTLLRAKDRTLECHRY